MIGRFLMNERKWYFYAACSVFNLILATLLGRLFLKAGFPETNIVLLYIMAVLMTSVLTKGYVYGIVVSVAATFVFNYFFTSPYLTFNVNDPSYIITFVIMTITAVIASTLTSGVKQNALDAMEHQRETQALYELTGSLTKVQEMQEAAAVIADSASRFLLCSAACLCFDESGMPESAFIQCNEDGSRTRQRLTEEVMEVLSESEAPLPFKDSGGFQNWPVRAENGLLCFIRIPAEKAESFSEAQRHFLYSAVECAALAMERIASVKQQVRSQQEIVQERYRGNLLRAISHDLRTPLSGIMGTSEMIMDMSRQGDPRYELAQGIYKDARWLHDLVENILSLTRLQEGGLILNKQPEAAEEIIGSAIARMAGRAPEYEIIARIPEDVLMAPMDGKLIMQVLINLMDNAVKHTPPDKEIVVSAERDEKNGQAVFKVLDRGEGIAAADLPNIFETFYTSQTKLADAKAGIGLGLTICESIIRAHGGSMTARNRKDGPGAEFTFTLPLEEKKEQSNEPVS